MLAFILAPRLFAMLRQFKMAQTFRDASVVGKLAELHESKKNTPTMGGLLIFISILVNTLLWAKPNIYIITSLLVFTGLTAIGFLDDYLKVSKKSSDGLAGRAKLLAQALLTLAVIIFLKVNDLSSELVGDIWIPFVKGAVIDNLHFIPLCGFFFFVLAGSSNAINLTDGIDGLAIGCTVTVALAFGIMAYASGNKIISDYLLISYLPGTGELLILCSSLLGSSLAFLWYNSHPAEVFMGDTGSLALGGLIGTIAFMIHQPFTLVIVGGIFVIEAVSVILQVGSFKMTGKRIFKMAPIHHHFELMGWHESKVVIRFWILSLIFAIIGLATLKLR